MATAVLDVGKTNVKVVLFEADRILWQRSAPNHARPGPPYPHLDVDGIWDVFITALAEAASIAPVDAIIVTTHGATATLVDEEGLVLPVMDYEYAGVDEIEAQYALLRPPFGETFSPPLSAGLNVGRQLFYLARRHPAAFARARHILMYPQYFVWRLTGVALGEATSLGCHGDLWRPAEARPSSLVDRLGWSQLLPPVRRAYEVAGSLKPDIAALTGLPSATCVLVGIHDSSASILPHLLTIEPPFTVVSTGTWVVVMAVGGSTARLDPTRDMMAYVDVEARPVPGARYMGGREYAVILQEAVPEADEDDVIAVLDSRALALPSFVPNGGPFPGRPGTIDGALPDRPGARAALASLYEALMTDHLLGDLGVERGPLLVEGSFAQNPLYCGLLAALRPLQPVLPSADSAGTAYGASLLAAWPRAPRRPLPPLSEPLSGLDGLTDYRHAWHRRLGEAE
jgi:sugar (pentulose or hexulose) kinase